MRGQRIVVVLLSLAVNTGRADGLLYKLPKDGTWATYKHDVSVKTAGYTIRAKATIRIASVGQVKEDGQPCRWIEMVADVRCEVENLPSEKPPTHREVLKFLIPEKFLVQGETPQSHVIRAWKRVGNGKPEKTKEPNLFLTGPPEDLKHLDKVEVESKLGKLACEGVMGTIEMASSDGAKERVVIETRLHPDAPFGVVSSRWAVATVPANNSKEGSVTKEAVKADFDLKLIDFGDKATSEMPDAR
jgi:hypothetical protein